MGRYYVVTLTDGTVLDFNQQCKNVKYDNQMYAFFFGITENGDDYVLAIIPHTSIYTIVAVDV